MIVTAASGWGGYGVTMLKSGFGLSSAPSSDCSADLSPDNSSPGALKSPNAACSSRTLLASVTVTLADAWIRRNLAVDQHTVAQGEPVIRSRIGEQEVEREIEIPTARPVDRNGKAVEDLVRRQLSHH